MKWISSILLNAILFLFLSLILPSFEVNSFGAAILAAIVLAFLNILVRPLLILFTLPATILSLGFFIFVINAIILLLTNKIMGDGFVINGFWPALLVALSMAALNAILSATVLRPVR